MRLLVGKRPLPMIFSPLMRLSGHNRSQETKWFSVSHLLIFHPASLSRVVAVTTSIASIRVRSVPVMRNSSARKSNCGAFPPLLFEPPFPLLFRQGGALAPVLSLLQILLELLIACGHLLLAKSVSLVL